MCTVSFLWAAWAYHKASQAIENLNENIRGICKRRELRRITGVGENIAKVIEEFLVSRRTESLEKMINMMPTYEMMNLKGREDHINGEDFQGLLSSSRQFY